MFVIPGLPFPMILISPFLDEDMTLVPEDHCNGLEMGLFLFIESLYRHRVRVSVRLPLSLKCQTGSYSRQQAALHPTQ